MVQGGVVCKDEILVHRQGEAISDFGHDFRLLHRVNTQFAFEVLVHFYEISRIAGVVHHNRNQHLFNIWMRLTLRWNGWGWRRHNGRRWCFWSSRWW